MSKYKIFFHAFYIIFSLVTMNYPTKSFANTSFAAAINATGIIYLAASYLTILAFWLKFSLTQKKQILTGYIRYLPLLSVTFYFIFLHQFTKTSASLEGSIHTIIFSVSLLYAFILTISITAIIKNQLASQIKSEKIKKIIFKKNLKKTQDEKLQHMHSQKILNTFCADIQFAFENFKNDSLLNQQSVLAEVNNFSNLSSIYLDQLIRKTETYIQQINNLADEYKQNNNNKHHQEDNLAAISNIYQLTQSINIKTEKINEIVFQTKILAINATIEASYADEEGKGFRVVAEEMKNLSKLSSAAAKDIDEILSNCLTTLKSFITFQTHIDDKEKQRHNANSLTIERLNESVIPELKILLVKASETRTLFLDHGDDNDMDFLKNKDQLLKQFKLLPSFGLSLNKSLDEMN